MTVFIIVPIVWCTLDTITFVCASYIEEFTRYPVGIWHHDIEFYYEVIAYFHNYFILQWVVYLVNQACYTWLTTKSAMVSGIEHIFIQRIAESTIVIANK